MATTERRRWLNLISKPAETDGEADGDGEANGEAKGTQNANKLRRIYLNRKNVCHISF